MTSSNGAKIQLEAVPFRELEIGLDLSSSNVVALSGCGREADYGPWWNDEDLTGSDKGTIPRVSPFPLPEQIIHLIIDDIRLEKERALAAFTHENSQSTSKAIDRAFRFDDDLKNLSLVSRLWTRPVRLALGRRFVLIMDEKRLPRLFIALESRLYGPWTTHVEILEMPCAPLRNANMHNEVWALVQRVLGRLENVQSFTINSRVLWSSLIKLPTLLASFKFLKEITIINTGIVVTSDSLDLYQKLANLSLNLPRLRKMTFRRCLPVGGSSSDWQPLTTHGPTEFADQLQAVKSSLFSSFNCCFMACLISFVFDREDWWSVDEITTTHLRGTCTARCTYNDPSGACAHIRSLRLVGDAKLPNPSCTANLLRNFANTRVLHLSLGLLPAEEVLDALSNSLEDVVFETNPMPNRCEFEAFDERLSRFCRMRQLKLRSLTLSLGEKDRRERCDVLFPLTDAFCSAHDVEFVVFYSAATNATD